MLYWLLVSHNWHIFWGNIIDFSTAQIWIFYCGIHLLQTAGLQLNVNKVTIR
jgi:hypothetical protein